MLFEILHRQEVSLQARINLHSLIESGGTVPFIIGRRFGDVGARHRHCLQTQLLGPFLTTEFGPEYILPTDIGQKSADEPNGLEVPSRKEGKDVIQHCRISGRSGRVKKGHTFNRKLRSKVDGVSVENIAGYDGHGSVRPFGGLRRRAGDMTVGKESGGR
jgi:hypothetical protein